MRSLPDAADVVVIGGGAVGLSCAYVLAGRGTGVVVLERDHVGAGASAGSACMVCPSHADRTASPASLKDGLRFLLDPKAPLKLRPRPSELGWVARFTVASLSEERAETGTRLLRRLAQRSTELHIAWAEELGTGLAMNGTLNVWAGDDAAAGQAAVVDEARHAGLAIEELDAQGIAALEPSVRDATHGALAPGDGHVDSLRFTECLADGVRARGGTIAEGVEVIRIDRSGPRIRLVTTDGTIEAGHVVVAAGVWTRRFADDVGVSLPITPAKGYHVEFAGAVADAQRPIYFADAHCVATPLEGRLRIAGTLEIGTDPEAIDMRRVDALREAGERFLGALPDEPSHIWLGQRPLTADSMPLIGPLPGDPRVVIASGHGTLGITLAPVTGELVAGHVLGELAEPDPLLDPARFR
ncbi:MAG: NAD(P)/FAD-dependent oxidoreductase [Gaiellales bacterium]